MFEYLKTTTATGLGCMFLVSMGAFLFGFDNGWWGTIQGAEAFLRAFGSCSLVDGVETCNISTPQKDAGSSVQSGGIMVGSLVAMELNKALGRRKLLVVTGMISITSSTEARGFAINMYQNVQIIGYCLAAGIVYASSKRDDAASYMIPIGLQFLAPVCMVTLSPLLPESPRWLVWNGRRDDAIRSASRLFGTKTNDFDAEKYIRELEIAFEKEQANPKVSSWRDLLHGPDFRRLLIAVGIQCWLQAQGSGYIVNYMVSFLQDSGTSDVFPFIMGLNFVYYGGILTGHFLPDNQGRRPVIIYSTAANAVFMLVIASINTAVSPSTHTSGAASVAFLFLWQLSSGVMSPLIWIICTEAAPTRNRERVLSIAVFISFGVSLMITSVSPYLQDKGYGNLGARIGYIWGAASVLTSVWSYVMVPESKGVSLEQLDYLYEQGVPARRFGKYHFTDAILPVEKVESEVQVQDEVVLEPKKH
ncbi:unnamed protein product [Clonostachys rhizophaga]|uniref:Major facilitator superfamily (MFS) profile domain-containing protein n=1 Tax=Clonostachys rhizophaga TaxID=160324 RepID=A0A9N9YXL8_9HYPO|nr:unnamed protein product [Clonostachys rhizophaga]